jgi:hypothetical protein
MTDALVHGKVIEFTGCPRKNEWECPRKDESYCPKQWGVCPEDARLKILQKHHNYYIVHI